MNLVLPWPPRILNPNVSKHWSQHARAKARFRAACAFQARAQGVGRMQAQRLRVRLSFVMPDRRVRDDQNLIAAMKSGLDGLADVIGIDDSKWHVTHDPISYDEIGGFVRVEVVPCPA